MVAIEVSYVPQIARLHRRKCAQDISLWFPALNVLGRLLAVAYAASIGEAIFGAGFVVGLATRSTFFAQVLVYRARARARARAHGHDRAQAAARPAPVALPCAEAP